MIKLFEDVVRFVVITIVMFIITRVIMKIFKLDKYIIGKHTMIDKYLSKEDELVKEVKIKVVEVKNELVEK
ncbi:MAG: hypothetical protein LHV68_05195 [Elusimicrobia bacterium]|nr:hypothetical protein [Candidatus Liberimonas magnetica]